MKRHKALSALGIVALAVLTAAGATPPHGGLTLCEEEDSTYCVWLGPVQGNGIGKVVINLGPDQWITLG